MEYKDCYAIATIEGKWVSLYQESSLSILVCEQDDILSASFIDGRNRANDIISELVDEKETQWEYSKSYKKNELRLIKICMSYCAL